MGKHRNKRRRKINHRAVLLMLKRRALGQQGGVCYHCEKPLSLAEATADHLIPRYQGGITKAGNIVAACSDCNTHRNKETDRHGGRLNISVGDDTSHSPFAVLAGLFK